MAYIPSKIRTGIKIIVSRYVSFRSAMHLRFFGASVGKGLYAEGRQILVIAGGAQIVVGNNVRIHDGVRIEMSHYAAKLTIEDGVDIGSNVILAIRGHLILKRGCLVGSGTQIICCGHIAVGEYTMIAGYTVIPDVDHGTDQLDMPMKLQPMTEPRPIIIEDDCWIGAHCTILRGVTIGQGSIIGANSIVRSDIPPYSVAVGAPAQIKRSRIVAESLTSKSVSE